MYYYVLGGTAVDPASKLEDEAHVYQDHDGTKYTVVLSQTDVVAQKNSYYKMQVLESDNKKKLVFLTYFTIPLLLYQTMYLKQLQFHKKKN